MEDGIRERMISLILENLQQLDTRSTDLRKAAWQLQEFTNQDLIATLVASNDLVEHSFRPMYYLLSGERICLN